MRWLIIIFLAKYMSDLHSLWGRKCENDIYAPSCKTLSPSGPMSYLHSLALRIWTSSWRREGSAGMETWNTPRVESRQSVTYQMMESVDLGGLRWHGSSWKRDPRERRLSAIDPHNRHTWISGVRSAMHAASKLPVRGPTDVDVAPVPAR